MNLNPEQRRAKAAEIADALNKCNLLADDVKFLLTDHTVYVLTTEQSFVKNPRATPKPQFLG